MKIENGDQLLALMRDYQIPCVLATAMDVGVFEALAESPLCAEDTAEQLACNPRAMTILLDALAGIGLLMKSDKNYSVPPELQPFVVDSSGQSVAAMLHHQANCLRKWAQLPWVIRSGEATDPGPSIRGEEADKGAFIEAMDVVTRNVADELIREINPGGFRCILDLGGASGTWTLAWLKAEPAVRAILFDLPHVIPMAHQRIADSGFAERVELVAGNFYRDPLPKGADLVWVSAIIHQNSRDENRAIYGSIAKALEPGGSIFIRDVVMEPSRTEPLAGALFAVNMLAATADGSTYTFSEIEEDLVSAGFEEVQLVRQDEGMHSVVRARLPRG